jgi:enoyl-CoA hydratase/carnithine racemase
VLVGEIERDEDLTVVVFTSSNREFFLAHYDTEGDPAKTVSMPTGPTGMHPWLDLTARLSRAPVVSISSIRGRARGAGSEFALATDIRLAGDKAILAQFEVGSGVVPGGGPMARLPRLIGRGRALEVLLVADDLDARLAERYGYVNRVVPDDELDGETDRVARRVASFDKRAIAETKAFVDAITLPADNELPPALSAFFASSARPATQARLAALTARGLGQDSELERRLGELVPLATP